MTGSEQSDRALMARVRAGFVDALVQLWSGGENEREKKSADEPRGEKRVSGLGFSSDETEPHWAGVCSLLRSGASTIYRLTLNPPSTFSPDSNNLQRFLSYGIDAH